MAKSAITLNSAHIAFALSICAVLTACNGGEETTASSSSVPGTSQEQGNSAASATLTLSGHPPASVTADTAYSFTPAVSSATSGLTYSITNLPPWASFDPASGTLSGKPPAASVGTYSGIVIRAGNGSASAALPTFAIAVTQAGTNLGSAALSWTPPTQNTDGTPIANLAGYNIYYGPSASAMTNKIAVTNPGLTVYTVADLASGTHYFGITAYTTGGVESGLSSVGSKTIM